MLNTQQSKQTSAPIHPDTKIGSATLKVADLQRSIAFYTNIIGLQILSTSDTGVVSLGVGTHPILLLEAVAGAKKQPKYSTGLYHIAILLPTRRDLAIKIKQFIELNVEFGYADHLVSEAFYLDDPDGNGLEIYRDRPRDEWQWQNGLVHMQNAQIDFNSLFAEIGANDERVVEMPLGTVIGHMHLRVGDVPQTQAFYGDLLGFAVTAKWPGALFMSAGGYHHHLGLNTWQSQGAKAPLEPSIGLRRFSLLLPTIDELTRLTQRFEAAQIPFERTANTVTVFDPWRTEIQLTVAE